MEFPIFEEEHPPIGTHHEKRVPDGPGSVNMGESF